MDVRTNGWRLRGAEIPAGSISDPDVVRVLVVGDSFTFGWGVAEQERYTERLQTKLSVGGRRVVVLNAGHWSFTLDQELLLIRDLVPRFRPQLVVQGLYPPGLLPLVAHRWAKDGQRRIAACYNDGIRVGDDGALRFTNDYLEKTPFRSRVVGSVFRVWFNWRLSREAMVGDMALLNPAVTRYEPAWADGERGPARDRGLPPGRRRPVDRVLRAPGPAGVPGGVERDLQARRRERDHRPGPADAPPRLDGHRGGGRVGGPPAGIPGPVRARTFTSASTRTGRLTGTRWRPSCYCRRSGRGSNLTWSRPGRGRGPRAGRATSAPGAGPR